MEPHEKSASVLFREVLSTTKHAATFFDLLVARLGDRAVVQTGSLGRSRRVHLRAGGDAGLILPWPLFSFAVTDPATLDAQEAEDAAQPPDFRESLPKFGEGGPIEMKFRAMAATATLHDGPSQLSINYRRDGRWQDSCDPFDPKVFDWIGPVLARRTDSALELLAEHVASLDLGRHGPGRVLSPRARPGGVEGVWLCGSRAIREALAAGSAPAGATWAVADGYCGRAIAFGPTREAALGAWKAEVLRVRPAPPKRPEQPALPTPDDSTFEPTSWRPDEGPGLQGSFMLVAAGWDAPPFDPSPDATPAAVVPISAWPARRPKRGEPVRFIGERGTTHFVVRLDREDGYTLVGEGLLRQLDLDAFDATLDALDESLPDFQTQSEMNSSMGVASTHRVVIYRCVDERTGAPTAPKWCQSGLGPTFDVGGFDANVFRWGVVRVTRME